MSDTLIQALAPLHDDIDPCWRTIGTRGDQSCPKLQEYLRCVNCSVYHDKAQALLERLPARVDDEADEVEFGQESSSERFNVLVFRLEGEWLAVPTRMLDEVSEPRGVHPVPHRRRGALLGLVNVRGALTPCISLARLLSLPADTSDRSGLENRGRMLIVKDGARQIAIPVDAVEGIHAIRRQAVTAAPATLSAGTQSVATGVVDCGKHRAGLIDPTRLQQALAGVLA
ncbi:purine-binding chemotaxis protein CheW [Pigmentiphaga aceris]|uniref:Chemotaxis protein CheW n=1 Tax=Pigmentiphaga aceris TaxID=1940612 RepID=A0A5C0AWK8_9BURK|nr:chemotaxis protein CheW [Pigmentiphaga aceris]QEI06789.1 purine-binding chemotaxis protein CheW [Pigmentiphaga aceris]